MFTAGMLRARSIQNIRNTHEKLADHGLALLPCVLLGPSRNPETVASYALVLRRTDERMTRRRGVDSLGLIGSAILPPLTLVGAQALRTRCPAPTSHPGVRAAKKKHRHRAMPSALWAISLEACNPRPDFDSFEPLLSLATVFSRRAARSRAHRGSATVEITLRYIITMIEMV